MLPKDFPKWYSFYECFRIWSEESEDHLSLLGEALKNVVGVV